MTPSWALQEIEEVGVTVMVILFPVLLLTYLVYHFILRRHLVGRFERSARRMGLAGGPVVALGYLLVTVILLLTCSSDRWLDPSGLYGWAKGGSFWVTLLLYLISAMSLGWWAGFFLPVVLSSPEEQAGCKGLGRRMVVASGVLAVLLLSSGSVAYYHWKKGSDRAGCIMNIRNAQQAMRSYQGMNNADWVTKEMLVGPDNFLEIEPVCPRGGTYTWGQGPVPPVGDLMLHCTCEGHEPTSTVGW